MGSASSWLYCCLIWGLSSQGQGYRTRKGRKCLFMHRSTSISNFLQYSPDGATDHASQVVAPYIRRHCCYLRKRWENYCKTLNFGHPEFWRLSQFNYFGPCNFSVFASYYTETLLYSNFRGPLFSRTCQAREIREIKGTRKNGFYSINVTERKKRDRNF